MVVSGDGIILPALGQDVQLGMLYNVRTSELFAGISLWDNAVVNSEQTKDENKVQNAEFYYSTSIEDSRKKSALDVEGSLALDLKIIQATGSAKYLSDTKSSTHEARLDASCTVTRWTRRIPQETLSSMKYHRTLDNPRFTHFVAEVVEGGSATISLVRSASSEEEAKEIAGDLKATLVGVPVNGSGNLEYKDVSDVDREKVKISYSGAIAENVSTWEDARRVTFEMPIKLAKQTNTLFYKLLPVDLLDSNASRLIRSLDSGIVNRTAVVLKTGIHARLRLDELLQHEVLRNWFPKIKGQIRGLREAFLEGESDFTEAARRLLPELRDGTTDYSTKISELRKAVSLFEQRVRIAEQFADLKEKELEVLQSTVASMLDQGFQNHLGGLKPESLTTVSAPRVLLSFGGGRINRSRHLLEKKMQSTELCDDSDGDGSDDEEKEESEEEWFDNSRTINNVRAACAELIRLRPSASDEVIFGVASVDKAYRPGEEKLVSTSIGDIILGYNDRFTIVTGMLPKAPKAFMLMIKEQGIAVSWEKEKSSELEPAIPTTSYVIRYRPIPNLEKDGVLPRVAANETFTELKVDPSGSSLILKKNGTGDSLFDDCDYEIMLSVKTIIGSSGWSIPAVVRTPRWPSVASRMIDFYERNHQILSNPNRKGTKPWDMDKEAGNRTLFLGHTTIVDRNCSDPRFPDTVAVRIVDVAVEFEANIPVADIADKNNTIVAVFTGPSGHGKSTEINAFVSYLLGGEFEDFARIMMIDDRSNSQTSSQFVTCYRIRPFSPLFRGKTMLIVDAPGFGDSRGYQRDSFVTAAMSDLFSTVSHVNAIFFTCRAMESRSTFLTPVYTYVSQLFAKDVQDCLRTIYTFGDSGKPAAHDTLQKLGWPLLNGEISVNNSAFTPTLDVTDISHLRDMWLFSTRGQFQIMDALLKTTPVPTDSSADVMRDRVDLEQKCALTEHKIFKTATGAWNLVENLDTLADGIRNVPDAEISITEDRVVTQDLPEGRGSTRCLHCNMTCHEICPYSNDEDIKYCETIKDEKCIICHCHWTEHCNMRYMIKTKRVTRTVVPEDAIKTWNENTNKLETSLLSAIDDYLELQQELRGELLVLAQLTERLMAKALHHDPSAFVNYMDRLIHTARAYSFPPAKLVQFATAKNMVLLLQKVKEQGSTAAIESEALLGILGNVRTEMHRRMQLEMHQRVREEKVPCSLYDTLYERLPASIKEKAPAPLREKGMSTQGELYPASLKAIVLLVKAVLKDGGVVAALAVKG
ncbi:neoverrucotoxin subunit beta [Fusarium longipes]|uniref:Neoverrucotoxin subunit beta n=1 Tax=Fusarium longipes TaxID=694270 RepID=A0A395T0U7_9HYPO|nr:neoverrucotoxin subunit beta [Fusarium longipes]